jgi:hypothetical protein
MHAVLVDLHTNQDWGADERSKAVPSGTAPAKQPGSTARAGEETHHDSFAESGAGRHGNWADWNSKVNYGDSDLIAGQRRGL